MKAQSMLLNYGYSLVISSCGESLFCCGIKNLDDEILIHSTIQKIDLLSFEAAIKQLQSYFGQNKILGIEFSLQDLLP